MLVNFNAQLEQGKILSAAEIGTLNSGLRDDYFNYIKNQDMYNDIRVKQAKFLAGRLEKTIGAENAKNRERMNELSKDLNPNKKLGYDLTKGEAGRYRRQ